MASAAPTSDTTFRPTPPALAADLARADRAQPDGARLDGARLDAAGTGTRPGESVTDLATRDAAVERAVVSLGDVGAGSEPDEDGIPANVLPLPVMVAVAVPLRNFRVRNLLAMRAGTVLESQWGHGEDIPLASGDVPLAWAEFEVVDAQLCVRVTRLA